jgi:DNA-binding transcriptional ArsR family regulator
MEMPVTSVTTTCVPAELAGRELLPYEAAGRLARTFQLLGNDTRLRLLHALAREGELSVGDLAGAIGMKTQATSNQLQQLVEAYLTLPRRSCWK